jgi:hydroxyquinol 1,2-dioxygenase
MDGHGSQSEGQDIAEALRARLMRVRPGRTADAVRLLVDHALEVLDRLCPSEAEFDAFVQFLTDVGYATDARRQEWVLLADVFGFTALVGERGTARHPDATPATLPGPFYRPDAPRLPGGADLCRDGIGEPLQVQVRVTDVDGRPLAGAEVEVWHANGAGRYENQDPDSQPEHNLRGRFATDAQGRFGFRTIRPAGYALPDDGPVGQLARRLGLPLERPAHIHFAVAAPGHRRLVTAIFDAADPAIARDALFAVRPALLGDFRAVPDGASLDVTLVLDRTP